LIVRGTIFKNTRFVFEDGAIGNKYLILLNTPSQDEPYLLVKTTSQQKNKPGTPGCIKNMSLFFVPAGKTFFPKDTWVQLYELYEVAGAEKDPNYRIAGSLPSKMVDEIIKCLLASQGDDISQHHLALLNRPLGQSLQKLKEHFNKR
jgi:hypothetical protein